MADKVLVITPNGAQQLMWFVRAPMLGERIGYIKNWVATSVEHFPSTDEHSLPTIVIRVEEVSR